MNNNEQNNVVPNNQTNTSTGINVPNVMPPTVAPPTVNSGANFASDGRILKPITPVEPVPEVTPEQNVAGQPVVEQPTPEQAQATPLPNVIVDTNGEAKDEVNTMNLEKVKVDYKPPSKFKLFLMFLMFAIILGCILFMDQITLFVATLNQAPVEDEVVEDTITSGNLICDLKTSNETYDLIYSIDISFTNKEIKSFNYDVATKGDKTLDYENLNLLYTNCKNLSGALSTSDNGASVSCDMFEGTVTESHSFDYSKYNSDSVKTLYTQYGISLPSFISDTNIDSVEKSLLDSDYTCNMTESNGS